MGWIAACELRLYGFTVTSYGALAFRAIEFDGPARLTHTALASPAPRPKKNQGLRWFRAMLAQPTKALDGFVAMPRGRCVTSAPVEAAPVSDIQPSWHAARARLPMPLCCHAR